MAGVGGVEQTRINPGEWFESRKSKYSKLAHKYKKLSKIVSWCRVVAFIATFALPATLLPFFSASFFLLTLLLLTIFIAIVATSTIIDRKHKYYQALYDFNHLETEALEGNFHSLPNDGKEYALATHNFNFDLDIFGKGSIFQQINRTCTPEGQDVLAGLFNNQLLSSSDIENRQKTLVELSEMPSFRETFYALSKVNSLDSPISNRLKELVGSAQKPQNRTAQVLTVIFPVSTVVLTILSLMGVISSSALIYLFFGGLMISSVYLRRVNASHNLVNRLADILNSYSKLFALVGDVSFKSNELDELAQSLGKSQKEGASVAVQKLAGIVKSFDLRLNFLLAAVLNGFLLWDMRQSIKVSNWVRRYGNNMIGWFDAIHRLEAYNSLAGYMFSNPDFCIPIVSDDITLKSENLGHPMISVLKRVNNDFELYHSPRIVILTGANMAGKSTFLRTIGINYLLATMGCSVCATSFIFRPLPLITNMRTSDSLLREESYFFAELKRLQFIVNEISSKGTHLFILDEILKGTNSIDKANGSKALTNKLLAIGGAGIIATHDLELGELADIHHGAIKNSCFEVTQSDGELIFDYKLREGVTSSHNATYLMKKMGLMD